MELDAVDVGLPDEDQIAGTVADVVHAYVIAIARAINTGELNENVTTGFLRKHAAPCDKNQYEQRYDESNTFPDARQHDNLPNVMVNNSLAI
ncbi:MAG: hypothetical protein BroJett007_18350 [Chloroflexota bacterium]|nr:MAG: hypothetical protein BroJett007_18350 [Chloroflexota bacterium]